MTKPASIKRCPCPEHEGPRELPIGAFGKHRSKPDGLKSWCKACVNRANSRWRTAAPEISRGASRRWTQANPEKAREKDRRGRQALRDAVLDHYGRVCVCCGSIKQLTIDHVNGDGRAHRLELFGTNNVSADMMYRWLINNGFPDGFQVLCHPCNASKADGPACRLNHAAA